jgi:hypothetical protein
LNYQEIHRLGFAVQQMNARRVFLRGQAMEAAERGYDLAEAELLYEAADLQARIRQTRKQLSTLMGNTQPGVTAH